VFFRPQRKFNHTFQQLIGWKANEEQKVQALIDAGYSADFNGDAYATVSVEVG